MLQPVGFGLAMTKSPQAKAVPLKTEIMRISDPKLIAAIGAWASSTGSACRLPQKTSLEIGGTSDLLLIRKHESLPELIRLLKQAGVPHRFLGGGSNVLLPDGELPWVILQLARQDPDVRFEGNNVFVDCAADLGRTVTTCAKHDLGGMEGLIGVPGIDRRRAADECRRLRHADRNICPRGAGLPGGHRPDRNPQGAEINFEYRHTSFAPDDIMLSVRLELPSKPYSEILQGIRICNEKRRASQPLNQKSAGCIFKNPPGGSAGRMIDELGLKGHSVGDARVSDRHANFFINAGHASAADMLALIADVRERVRERYGVELEEEVIVWKAQ